MTDDFNDEQEDIYDLYIDALLLDDDFETIQLPVEPYPGESNEDAMVRWLIEEEIFIPTADGGFAVDQAKAEAFDPNLGKLLRTMLRAEIDMVLNQLEEEGLVYSTVDEKTGDIVYGLTDAGKEYNESISEWTEEA